METEIAALYEARSNRVYNAIQLKKPDRIPIVSLAGFFLTRYGGITNKVAMYDYENMAHAWKSSLKKLQWDMAPQTMGILPGPVMDAIGLKTYKWPGNQLKEDLCYQYVEKEYLKADEYDELMQNPEGLIIRKIWPRITSAFEPFQNVPPLALFSSGTTLMFGLGRLLNTPEMKQSLDSMIEFRDEIGKWLDFQNKLDLDIKEMGFPTIGSAVAKTTFDWISDDLRGLNGSIFDMFRQPDKLKKVVQFYTPIRAEASVAAAKQSGSSMVFIPLHRGSAEFMSDEQFEEFYWPNLKYLLLELIDAGLTPVPFFEGNYTPRLKYLAELPKGKIAGHFDVVDIKEFKRVLGNVMCFWGNVPASLLVTGKPVQVEDFVKGLIDTFGDTGGLIVDGGVDGVPQESKIENVEAMTKTVFEYGVC